MLFRTESGSSYEVSLKEKKIRRLSGINDPTSRQGSDGEWKEYFSISNPVIGKGLWIAWKIENSHLGKIAKSTITSPIISLELEN